MFNQCSVCCIRDKDTIWQPPNSPFATKGSHQSIDVKTYKDPDYPDDRSKDVSFCDVCLNSTWTNKNVYGGQMRRAECLSNFIKARKAGIDLGEVDNTIADFLISQEKFQ